MARRDEERTTYDASLDEMLHDFGNIPGTKLVLELKRYNSPAGPDGQPGPKGAPKVQIARLRKDPTKRSPGGRMTIPETEALVEFLRVRGTEIKVVLGPYRPVVSSVDDADDGV